MKTSFKLFLALVALMVGARMAFSACTRTDFLCYQTGPSQNLSTPFRVDSSGNLIVAGTANITGGVTQSGSVTVSGNQTIAGSTIFTATSQTAISTTTSISPTATYMTVLSTGATVNYPPTTPAGAVITPAISTATATNGQIVVLMSTSSVSTVTISTGTGSAVIGDDSLITISATKSAVMFIFNSTLSQWYEVTKQ